MFHLKNKKAVQVTLNDLKFDKGLATLKKTGKKYTGTVIHKTKDNATVSLSYLDSVLQEAKKVNSDNTIAYVKKYTTEKEILLPRNANFKVIGPMELEYILPD